MSLTFTAMHSLRTVEFLGSDLILDPPAKFKGEGDILEWFRCATNACDDDGAIAEDTTSYPTIRSLL